MNDQPCLCYKCKKPTEVFGSRWCANCYYPSIDQNWQWYKDLLEEGYPRYAAKVMAGFADPYDD